MTLTKIQKEKVNAKIRDILFSDRGLDEMMYICDEFGDDAVIDYITELTPKSDPNKCSNCDGSGKVVCQRCDGCGDIDCECNDCGHTHSKVCDRCEEGYLKCNSCNGSGRAE